MQLVLGLLPSRKLIIYFILRPGCYLPKDRLLEVLGTAVARPCLGSSRPVRRSTAEHWGSKPSEAAASTRWGCWGRRPFEAVASASAR